MEEFSVAVSEALISIAMGSADFIRYKVLEMARDKLRADPSIMQNAVKDALAKTHLQLTPGS